MGRMLVDRDDVVGISDRPPAPRRSAELVPGGQEAAHWLSGLESIRARWGWRTATAGPVAHQGVDSQDCHERWGKFGRLQVAHHPDCCDRAREADVREAVDERGDELGLGPAELEAGACVGR